VLCRVELGADRFQSARGLAHPKTWRSFRVPCRGEYPAQIVAAGFILDIETEAVAVPVEFGADDGFNVGFSGRLSEFDGAVEIIFCQLTRWPAVHGALPVR
jgi:hypothetical protein